MNLKLIFDVLLFIRSALFLSSVLLFSGYSLAQGISEDVKLALYEEGFQAAVEAVDSLEDPTVDESFFVIYVVDNYGAKTNRLDFYKSSNYKISESYKLDTYLNNVMKLNDDEYFDLKRLAKTNLLAETFLYSEVLIESLLINERYKQENIPFYLYTLAKDETIYRVLSSFFIGISAFDRFGSGDCVGLNLGSLSAFWIYTLYGDKVFTNCDVNKDDFDLFSSVLPMKFEPEILIAFDDNDLDKVYNFWYENRNSSLFTEKSVERECEELNFNSARERKLCFIMALGAADHCSLPLWSEFDTTVRDNDRWVSKKGWVKTTRYKECKINYIKEYIGRK